MKILLFITLLFASCGQQIPNSNVERENTFAKFQQYIDKKHQGWKVIGMRKESTTLDDNGTDRSFYYLLLEKDTNKQSLFVVMADFEKTDGTTETFIYEPNKQTLQKREAQEYDDEPVEEPQI